MGVESLTISKGEKNIATILRLVREPGIHYLYGISPMWNDAVSWDDRPEFIGIYHQMAQGLFLTKDSLDYMGSVTDGDRKMFTVAETLTEQIRRAVEQMVGDDRNNLTIRELPTLEMDRVKYYVEYKARKDAAFLILDGQAPPGHFQCDFTLYDMQDDDFLNYLRDPQAYIQTQAKQYFESHQADILRQLLETEALVKEYQALMDDPGNSIHRKWEIAAAVKNCCGKNVTVSIQKDGKALTFKIQSTALTGCRDTYPTWDIPAADRREFERLFGRYGDFSAEDITKITYGRNTIYEAPEHPALDFAADEEQQESGPMLSM